MAASERSTGPSCPLYLAAHLSNLKLAKPRAFGVALREALHNVVRHRDPGVPLGHIKDGGGDPEPTAWNRLRAGIVWDEPLGYHGRVHIPRHDGGRVTGPGRRTTRDTGKSSALSRLCRISARCCGIGAGHYVNHEMKEFTDTLDSRRSREPVQRK